MQAFASGGEGIFGREREWEGNAFIDAIVFVIFHFHQRTAKIVIVQTDSMHVNRRLNTVIRLVEINITLYELPAWQAFKRKGVGFTENSGGKGRNHQSRAKVIPFVLNFLPSPRVKA